MESRTPSATANGSDMQGVVDRRCSNLSDLLAISLHNAFGSAKPGRPGQRTAGKKGSTARNEA